MNLFLLEDNLSVYNVSRHIHIAAFSFGIHPFLGVFASIGIEVIFSKSIVEGEKGSLLYFFSATGSVYPGDSPRLCSGFSYSIKFIQGVSDGFYLIVIGAYLLLDEYLF